MKPLYDFAIWLVLWLSIGAVIALLLGEPVLILFGPVSGVVYGLTEWLILFDEIYGSQDQDSQL